MRRSPMPPRRTPLRSAAAASPRPVPARRKGAQQAARSAAVRDEWSAFSAAVRVRRPRCEAGPVLGHPECRGAATMVHHKTPRGRGPVVPSQGLGEGDVVAVCAVCHDAIHGSRWGAAARAADLLR